MPRINGRYQKAVMELYEECQLDNPLTDDQVNKLFGKEDLDNDEIQKIYPKRIIQYGSSNTVNPTQTNTDYSVTDKDVVNVCLGDNQILFLNSRNEEETIEISEIEEHLKDYPKESVTETIEHLKTYKTKISNIYALSEAIVKKKIPHVKQESTSTHFKASQTAKQLEDKVKLLLPDLKPSETNKWPFQIQKIHEEKEVSYEQLQQLIDYAHQDEFWSSIILNPRSLSNNMLKLQAQKNNQRASKGNNQHADKEPFDMPKVETWNIGENNE
jgi:hypothetical protein